MVRTAACNVPFNLRSLYISLPIYHSPFAIPSAVPLIAIYTWFTPDSLRAHTSIVNNFCEFVLQSSSLFLPLKYQKQLPSVPLPTRSWEIFLPAYLGYVESIGLGKRLDGGPMVRQNIYTFSFSLLMHSILPGDVYLGTNVLTNEAVAIKMEDARTTRPKLRHEYKVYQALAGYQGIPRALWFGTERGYNAIIMSLLGPSLEDLFDLCGRRFGLKTVLLLADQLVRLAATTPVLHPLTFLQLSHLEHIHDQGYVHRDLKPENLLIGASSDNQHIYVVDFGLATQYFDSDFNQHIPLARKSTITGTARYLSVHAHLGVEHTRRDDLESLCYILLYFLRGSLPWQNLEAKSRKQKYQSILQKKNNVSIATLCEGQPDVFLTSLNYARGLAFDVRPDYKHLRMLFRRTFDFLGYVDDNVFDWSRVLPVSYSDSSN